MTWREISGGGGTNPFDIVSPTSDYTASGDELVISNGYKVTLPNPSADDVVGVSNVLESSSIAVNTSSGNIDNDVDTRVEANRTVFFGSDGSNWYVVSDRNDIFFSELNHIETIVANSVSSVDFTNVFASDDGYERYEVFVDNVISDTDGVNMQARFSSDGGSTWDFGTSDYAYAEFYVQEAGGTASFGSGSTSEITLERYIGNNASGNDVVSGSLTISNPTNLNKSSILNSNGSTYLSSRTDSFKPEISGGIRLTQSSIDSIQFFMSSGNISSGIFSVYGVDN